MTRSLAALCALLVILSACAGRKPEDRLDIRRVSYQELPGWERDDHAQALGTYLRSCEKLTLRADNDKIGTGILASTAREWKEICDQAEQTPPQAARQFFEQEFVPYRASNRGREEGLFTGYYEPLVRAAREPRAPYLTPLYRVPPPGQENVTRADINRGALSGRNLELVWVDDPIDAFFLEIQGSGRAQLDTGETIRLGFHGKNNEPYVAIGKLLVDRGEMTKEEASLFSIKEWLRRHPDQAQALMEENPSYVFFEERKGEGPLGAQGVALTPERSLAIDSRFIPYGMPVYVQTTLPAPLVPASLKEEVQLTSILEYYPTTYYHRLFIAQDRGGAIKGAVRGDIFWGFGPQAERVAGEMKQAGFATLLLPRPLAERIGASGR